MKAVDETAPILDADALLQAATAQTGLADYGDDTLPDRLRTAVAFLRSQGMDAAGERKAVEVRLDPVARRARRDREAEPVGACLGHARRDAGQHLAADQQLVLAGAPARQHDVAVDGRGAPLLELVDPVDGPAHADAPLPDREVELEPDGGELLGDRVVGARLGVEDQPVEIKNKSLEHYGKRLTNSEMASQPLRLSIPSAEMISMIFPSSLFMTTKSRSASGTPLKKRV